MFQCAIEVHRYYSLTFDGYSKGTLHNVIGVCVHLPTGSVIPLGVVRLVSENSDTVVDAVLELLRKWELFNDKRYCVAATSDNCAAAALAATNLVRRGVASFNCGCAAHILDLSLKDGFFIMMREKAVELDLHSWIETTSRDAEVKSLEKLMKASTKIRKSSVYQNALRVEMEKAGQKYLVPVQQANTRWGSTYGMLQRAKRIGHECFL
mmetsp:Transcript_2009/g.6321  ORF Transcript_2009/g.6321 Transcript_2009/m.6321 type:complete len:209 (+) Transcript_2009:1054-1680(+)